MFLQIRCSIKNLFPYHAKIPFLPIPYPLPPTPFDACYAGYKKPCKIFLVQIYPVFVNCLFAYSFFYWLIDWFLYLSFFYTSFYKSPNTNWNTFKKRTENNTWIMAKTDIQSTHAFRSQARKPSRPQSPFVMHNLWGLGTKFVRTAGSTGASTSAGGDLGGSFTSDDEESRGRNYNLASDPSYWKKPDMWYSVILRVGVQV